VLVVGVWLLTSYPFLTVVAALFWVLPVFVGYRLTVSKGRSSPLLLAFFLGWIGVLFALVLRPAGRRCPSCDETIRRDATVCRFCGRESSPAANVSR